MAELHDPVSKVPGVGMVRAAALRCRGIQTVEDLLLQLPFRYEDRSKVSSISELIVGESYTFNVKVNRIRRLGHRGRNRVEAVVSDETGELKVVWFRQPYVADAIAKGDPVSVFGKVVEHDGNPQLVNPVLEKGGGLHLGRLVPIYRRIGKLTPGVLRRLIDACIDLVGEVPESLPGLTRRRLQLAGRHEAVVGIHRPTSTALSLIHI